MLPLHGQGTAAIELRVIGQDEPLIVKSGGNVFVKQSELVFAEFLIVKNFFFEMFKF